MNTLADWLLSTLIVTSVLAALVLGTARFFRHQPALQHLLWLVVLFRFLCPTVFAVSIPESMLPVAAPLAARGDVPEPQAAPEIRNEATPEASQLPVAPAELQPPETNPEGFSDNSDLPSFADDATRFPWDSAFAMFPRAAILISLAGSIVAGVVQAARILRFKHRIRLASPAPEFLAEAVEAGAAELGTRSIPAIVLSGVSIPLVWCLGRTRLLWPEMLAGRDDVQRCRGAILHELAHVRRRDHWVSWVDLVAGIIWWWNPVFWLVRRRLHESAELACDALALGVHDNDRREYAELFLELSLHRMPAFPPGVGLCSGARKLFERRLTMMLSDVVRPSIPRRGWALAIALAVIAAPAWSISRATVDPDSSTTDRSVTGSDAADPVQTLPGITKDPTEDEDPSRDDRKRLQGTWDIVGFVHNDKEERNSFKLYQLTFKDGEVTTNWIREDDEKGGGTNRFSVDATRQPRELLMEGDNLRIQAIYRFEKDQLTLAFFGKPEKTRPQGFTVKDAGDSGDPKLPLMVWRLKRGAPGVAPEEDAVASEGNVATGSGEIESNVQRTKQPGANQLDASQIDRNRLQWTWDVVKVFRDDKEVPSSLKLFQWTFHGDNVISHHISNDGKQRVATGEFSVDATRNPRELQIEGKNLLVTAIYRFEGDELTIAFFGASRKVRPQGFTLAEAGNSGDPKRALMLWKLKRGTPAVLPEEEPVPDSADSPATDDVTARFLYPDTMLLLSSEAGVAAVVFTEVINEARRQGVRYEYRFESRDGSKKLSGEGELFETRDREGKVIGKLSIEAGDIRVRWSIADTDKGWIYYSPEKLRVQLANAKDFRDRLERRPGNDVEQTIPAIDLNRFQLPKAVKP